MIGILGCRARNLRVPEDVRNSYAEELVIVGAQVDAAGEWRILAMKTMDGTLVDERACFIQLWSPSMVDKR